MFAHRRVFVALLTVALAFGLVATSARAQDEPSVAVVDQVVTLDTVVIDTVVAAEDGWLVIHASSEGRPGIGAAPVKAGTNEKVMVHIDMSKATPEMSGMLHIDAGEKGVYEFPGADVPVRVGEQVVNVPFKAIGVHVDDQFAKESKKVMITSVLAQEDGYIVIHSGADKSPAIGSAPIKAGLNANVEVDLSGADAALITDNLSAMIHIDAGTIGTYEFPGADVPARLGEAISNEPFATVETVRVMDQALSKDGTLTVPSVLSAKDGWMVIHSSAEGFPVIGYAPVKAGLNLNVAVKIDDPSKVTEEVLAMLHVDAGTAGTYEFPGADVPVKDAAGNTIAPRFKTTGMAMMMSN